jgi:hypothetical protein
MALIPNFAPQWTSRDSSDFGIVLLELFAYLGDLLNYQIDRAANESFIDTATQRETVIKLANLLGYYPTASVAAKGTVTFTNSTASPVTVAAGTTISTPGTGAGSSVSYTLDNAVTVSAISAGVAGTASGNVTQGIKVTNEAVGTSDGTSNQTFRLANTGTFIDDGLSVAVGGSSYTRVTNILTSVATDTSYVAYTDGDGYTYVKFGDNVSGKIPPKDSAIVVTYRYTTTPPSTGNISASTISVISGNTGLNVSNASAFSGGSDAESTESIRNNAPKALRALTRAVSLEDYESLAVTYSNISKANAIATSFGSISLFLAGPNGSAVSAANLRAIEAWFAPKTPPGTTVVASSFTPTYPYLNVSVNVLPQYNNASVQASVQDALATLFNFDGVTFADLISEGDIFAACKAVDGVNYITINDFEKLPAVYSQTATTSATLNTGSTTVTVGSSAGLWVGAKITDTSNAAIAGLTIATIVSSTSITLSAAPSSAVVSPLTFTVQGNAGITAGFRDLTTAVTEVPIYEPSYITVTATGGS